MKILDKTTRMNKEKREKKQKKKKADDSSIGELIITDNINCDFSYLSTFNMDSLLKETIKLPVQCIKEHKNNKVSTTFKDDQAEKNGNVDHSPEAVRKLIQLCESI